MGCCIAAVQRQSASGAKRSPRRHYANITAAAKDKNTSGKKNDAAAKDDDGEATKDHYIMAEDNINHNHNSHNHNTTTIDDPYPSNSLGRYDHHLGSESESDPDDDGLIAPDVYRKTAALPPRGVAARWRHRHRVLLQQRKESDGGGKVRVSGGERRQLLRNDDDDDAASPAPRLYILIHGVIYDVTEFQHAHPGGSKVLQQYGVWCGKRVGVGEREQQLRLLRQRDASTAFNAAHYWVGRQLARGEWGIPECTTEFTARDATTLTE